VPAREVAGLAAAMMDLAKHLELALMMGKSGSRPLESFCDVNMVNTQMLPEMNLLSPNPFSTWLRLAGAFNL
jgi:hypothetical protein